MTLFARREPKHVMLCEECGCGCVCDARSRARALRDAQRERALRFGLPR
jgi:hypothetical protein